MFLFRVIGQCCLLHSELFGEMNTSLAQELLSNLSCSVSNPWAVDFVGNDC